MNQIQPQGGSKRGASRLDGRGVGDEHRPSSDMGSECTSMCHPLIQRLANENATGRRLIWAR
eukprot:CAMPEP_0119383494 /NCGR_PEP_ID=MMETSP1334-20130426/79913_1 /TAXON_ID=127549 /ORGANISM="Calcidiscus leptoporus, Strain RCC1130" /LENGTH=61 /DNA_ID=CAMNT_0007404313 /DNA_START=142 /DNA_END=324 /DNA_ORIENTATION=+